ncbi:hypothetical protein [Colwellia sp. C1TZA3]|uniref:hypothetical protein n=1 Tax=Colwellia sp. C1TZA3 TaxID=2508879 RepID=UPI0011B9D49D|nr:hypothetical protein [Colwellia sp. C1TZA3]TWX65834.1 hypothetical protein ESZ39_14700 [Colwellia sp. C1TZA3]
MDKLEISWSQSMPVWWSFFWRATVFGAVAGAILGGIGGVIVALIGKPELAATIGGVAGYIAAIPVSIYCMKHILNKSFKGYSLRFVKDESM